MNSRKVAKHVALMIPPIRRLYDELLQTRAQLFESQAEAARAQVEFIDRWCGERLLPQARENLFAAKTLQAAAGQPFLGTRWDDFSKELIRDISNFSSIVEAINYAQTKIGFETRVNEEACGQFVDGYMDDLQQTYPHCATFIAASGESPLSLLTDKNGVINRKGKLLALQQIINVEVFCFIFTKLGMVPECVLEIGGGYGSSCRDWVNMSGEYLKKYFILDIPESLFYSEVYLKVHFGADSVVNMAASNAEAKFHKAKIILCPLPMIDKLLQENINIAINVGSMQEMSGEWLDYYEKFLSTSKIENFYSSNYFFQPLNCLLEGMNLFTPRLGVEWRIAALEFLLASPEAQHRNVMRTLLSKSTVSNGLELEDDVLVLENRPADKPIDRSEGEALFRFIFAFRRGVPAGLSLRVIRALSTNFLYIPKETLYLVRHLLQDGQILSTSERQELEVLCDRLVAMLPAQREDVI